MFSVGDEIIVVDESPWDDGFAFDLKKGDTFTVLAVWPEGSRIGPNWIILSNGISIGKNRTWNPPWDIYTNDLWPAERFRKIERKRTREELHALIGISDMLGQRTPELV